MKKLKSACESVFDHLPVCLFLVKKKMNFSSYIKTLIIEKISLYKMLTSILLPTPM